MPRFERDIESFAMASQMIWRDGVRFRRGEGPWLYVAVMPDGREIPFGNRNEPLGIFRDRVPAEFGGKPYKDLAHGDVHKRFLWRRAVKQSDGEKYKTSYTRTWFEWQLLQ